MPMARRDCAMVRVAEWLFRAAVDLRRELALILAFAGRRSLNSSLARRCKELLDIVPVHHVVEERLEVVGAPVAVVDVIGVLPHVAAKDRFCPMHQGVFAIRRFHYGELSVLDREPGPAGSEL